MTHTTVGWLRAWLAEHADKPDTTPLRVYLEHGQGDYDPTFGEITGTLHSPPEDSESDEYLALRVRDTDSLNDA